MRISDWSSDVCSSDLYGEARAQGVQLQAQGEPVIPDPRCLESVRVFRSSDVHLAADVAIKEAQHLRVQRSEERRVGKECVSTCRSRWSPSHQKNNHYNYQHPHKQNISKETENS